MAKLSKTLWVLAFIVFVLVLVGMLVVIFQSSLYRAWIDIISPKHHVFQPEVSHRIEVPIEPNPEGNEWLGLRWSKDGKQIELYNSRSPIYASKLLAISAENGTPVSSTITFERGEIPGLPDTLPFTLDDGEVLWGVCLSQDTFFTGKEIEYGLWEPRLRKDGRLINFQPIEYYEAGEPAPVGLVTEFSSFSPDCRYFTKNISGQLWLLDTTEKTFLPLINGRKMILSNFDYPYQSLRVGWSPNSREFVFGDGIFGVETYNLETHQREWLLEPSYEGYNPDWSRSGRWISVVVEYDENNQFKVIIISPDGDKIGTLETCDYIEYPAWSPIDDRVAFICRRNRQKYLIVWNLSD